MSNPTIQIINGPEFMNELAARINEETFMKSMEINGLSDLTLDANGTMQLLNRTSYLSLKRYAEEGKEDVYGNRHYLEPVHSGNKHTRYRLMDVLKFRNAVL